MGVMRALWSCYWNLEQISLLRMRTIWMWWTWLWDRETKSVCRTQNIERLSSWSMHQYLRLSSQYARLGRVAFVCGIELSFFFISVQQVIERHMLSLFEWLQFLKSPTKTAQLSLVHVETGHYSPLAESKQTASWVILLDRLKARKCKSNWLPWWPMAGLQHQANISLSGVWLNGYGLNQLPGY